MKIKVTQMINKKMKMMIKLKQNVIVVMEKMCIKAKTRNNDISK